MGGRCGRPPGQPQRCSALTHEEQMTGPSASFTMFSTSLSVSLYAIRTRTSPPNSIHRHVLQPLAFSRRVIAFTSWRAVHVCRDRDLIDRIELSLCAHVTLLLVPQPSSELKTSLTLPHCHSSIRASPTLPPFAGAIKPRSRLHWVGLRDSFCNKR